MSSPEVEDPVTVAQAVRAAIEAVPDVVAVSAGRFARVGTYGPNGIVQGVALSREADGVRFEIHIVASSSVQNLQDLAESVRNVTRDTARNFGLDPVQRIDVVIEDLRDEDRLR